MFEAPPSYYEIRQHYDIKVDGTGSQVIAYIRFEDQAFAFMKLLLRDGKYTLSIHQVDGELPQKTSTKKAA